MSHADLFVYCEVIRAAAASMPLLVATHNQLAAREIGGRTALLAGGRIVEARPTADFFQSPRTASAKQFVRTGSCPSPSPDTLAADVDPDLRARFPELFEANAPPPEDFFRECESARPPRAEAVAGRRTPTIPYRDEINDRPTGEWQASEALALTRSSYLPTRVSVPTYDASSAPPPPISGMVAAISAVPPAIPPPPPSVERDVFESDAPGDLTWDAEVEPEPEPVPRRPRANALVPRLRPTWVHENPPRTGEALTSVRRLGGCRRPGLLGDLDDDLQDLRDAGVDVLVSLEAEHRVDSTRVAAHGIIHHQVPFPDMKAPAAHDMIDLCIDIDKYFANDYSICVHCRAGLGRTGTILAGYLIWRGFAVDHAIASIRLREPKFVSTEVQEQFLVALSEAINVQRSG